MKLQPPNDTQPIEAWCLLFEDGWRSYYETESDARRVYESRNDESIPCRLVHLKEVE